jgi:hypothetical protein
MIALTWEACRHASKKSTEQKAKASPLPMLAICIYLGCVWFRELKFLRSWYASAGSGVKKKLAWDTS